MKDLDPALVVYTVGGLIIVFATFIVFALLSEGVKSIHQKFHEEENKKKDEQKSKRAA